MVHLALRSQESSGFLNTFQNFLSETLSCHSAHICKCWNNELNPYVTERHAGKIRATNSSSKCCYRYVPGVFKSVFFCCLFLCLDLDIWSSRGAAGLPACQRGRVRIFSFRLLCRCLQVHVSSVESWVNTGRVRTGLSDVTCSCCQSPKVEKVSMDNNLHRNSKIDIQK